MVDYIALNQSERDVALQTLAARERDLAEKERELASANRKIVKLERRLSCATTIAESTFVSTWRNLPIPLVAEIQTIGALGYSAHVSIDSNGNVMLKAFKRGPA